MKTPDFMSYDRYKKKKKKDTSKNGLLLGITTFFVTLLLFTVVAKSFSPNVDVTIGDDSQTDAKDTGLGVKKFIDERLKVIQMEDNSAGVSVKNENKKTSGYNDESFNKFTQELDEKISLPTSKGKSQTTNEGTMSTPAAPPRPTSRELSTPFVTPKMSKVYVGRYATVEQAKVAQGILLDSGLDITPFVKDMGGFYTLQVGSYSNRAKAEGLASELQRNNFPARVIQEQ
ncbi:MAG: SPOR domain-containing protein [Candidatus Gastranaerophilaceae bacterium]